jgi:hypothetical protein
MGPFVVDGIGRLLVRFIRFGAQKTGVKPRSGRTRKRQGVP